LLGCRKNFKKRERNDIFFLFERNLVLSRYAARRVMAEDGDLVNAKLSRLAELRVEEMPDAYRVNSRKEELMLECVIATFGSSYCAPAHTSAANGRYVGKFVRHFSSLHPERPPLMLTPCNECGRRKFVCTTLRPTQARPALTCLFARHRSATRLFPGLGAVH